MKILNETLEVISNNLDYILGDILNIETSQYRIYKFSEKIYKVYLEEKYLFSVTEVNNDSIIYFLIEDYKGNKVITDYEKLPLTLNNILKDLNFGGY